eukprot:CAMPEP_0201496496 /NCGR_PEP_ID=MMETSP0151_2-20130828/60093_1 /ASSEMBLY_ACC=CAM_ASM_000257 /TAXON_ID=200890 /ORGANISM="Paramoeba atlantica, Strain 621/1 / CCAP 1560/9" /LENGTH=314 /DNA_ID=CAMNT_0047886361 /DNA_START=112 /DNA_END=1056 /DNA_ORIENTATION=-
MPLLNENPKQTMYLHGKKSSAVDKEVLNAISKLQSSQHAVKLRDNNDLVPFERVDSLNFLSFQNDCSLFCFSHHSKKRPHGIVLGRHHNSQLLDLVELGLANFEQKLKGLRGSHGHKPILLFLGAAFEFSIFRRLQNLLLDFFGGTAVENLNLCGADRALVLHLECTAELEDTELPTENLKIVTFPKGKVILSLRHVALLPSSGTKTLSVTSDDGLLLQFEIRRLRFANAAFFKRACRQPRLAKSSKGVQRDRLGDLKGQVHVGKQKVDTMTKRRFKHEKEKKQHADEEITISLADAVGKRRKSEGIPNPAVDI